MALASALFLGVYDVFKKKALSSNGVLYVLLATTSISCLLLAPFYPSGSPKDHLMMLVKGSLVTISWVSGLLAMKLLPLTTASTLKATRPVFVVIFSIILFGERLNLWQWAGVVVVLGAIFCLSGSSRKEGIDFRGNRGVYAMAVSVLFGAASALLDKRLLMGMEPLFVQCWANFYIMILLAGCVGVDIVRKHGMAERFRWDWTLLLVSALIVSSDLLYFFSLKQEGALLSVISLLRRCSVVITFGLGAVMFKEKLVLKKGIVLAFVLCGMTLLLLGTV